MYFQIMVHYNYIRVIVNSTIHILSASSPTYSIKTYKPMHLIEMLIPLKQLGPLEDVFVYYSRLAMKLSLISCVIVGVIYIPFLLITFQSTLKPRGLSGLVKKQQAQILVHAMAEFVMVASMISILIYMLHFPGNSFLHSPGYWIAFHTTLDLVLAIGVNISIFLIRCTTSSTNQINGKSHMDDSESEQRKEMRHDKVEDENLQVNQVGWL
ncbi:hypothetical protein DFH28DRAFT_941649 [Melampsora americana]|nr:hypothetical protein DFH28DRAFT_941649 [Melampsora americana]